MHHVRLVVTHGLTPETSAAIEASVLEAVGECYVHPVARLSRTDGHSYGQCIEFDCSSPSLATALAADAGEITGGAVELTIDGRWFPVQRLPAAHNSAIRVDERSYA